MNIVKLVLFTALLCTTYAFADEQTATVTTKSGTYTVPVQVENGQVTHVEWPNGGNMSVRGGELNGGQADGQNSRGDAVHIDLNRSSSSSSRN
jgi:hypothetical protein